MLSVIIFIVSIIVGFSILAKLDSAHKSQHPVSLALVSVAAVCAVSACISFFYAFAFVAKLWMV